MIVALMCGLGLAPGGTGNAAHAAENMGVCRPSSSSAPTTAARRSVGTAAAIGTGAGYAFIEDCYSYTKGQYVNAPLTPASQYTTSGQIVQYVHVSTGVYNVKFPGLGALGGVAHATAYGASVGTTAVQCRVGGWNPSGSDQIVSVYCFDVAGNPVDWEFDVTYTNLEPTGYEFGYLWADQPGSPSYTPASTYQYSSAGTANTVQRTGVGQYTVTMSGITAGTGSGNSVMAEAYGAPYSTPAAARCRVAGSYGQTASVACFVGKTPVDAYFTMTYVGKGNLLGLPNVSTKYPGGLPSGYAWIFDAAEGGEPWPDWRFSTPGPGTWSESYDSATGVATVNMPVPVEYGDVQVVAWGSGPATSCVVTDWHADSTGSGISVRCTDDNGAFVDSPFNVFFIGMPA
jgi:hypothetical protein